MTALAILFMINIALMIGFMFYMEQFRKRVNKALNDLWDELEKK